MNVTLETATIETPAGSFRVATKDGALVAAGFEEATPRLVARLEARFGPLELREAPDPGGAVTALGRFLSGDLGGLDGLRVDLGGTPFQREVWAALRAIPAGTTTTYGELAKRVGRPRAVRAVGSANAANPVSIVVPCHRVVGKDGLRGYAGGIARKEWLLEHEGAVTRAG